MRWFIGLLLMLHSVLMAQTIEPEWKWLRVEAGIPNAVITQGQAATVSAQAGSWILKLSDRDKVINEFIVHVRKSGDVVIAEFEPPNSERVRLQFKGIRRETPTGKNEVFEEMIFSDARSGNFMLLSRFKKAM